MANTVYKVEEVILQDGSVVTLKPAPIKVARKGNEMINNLDKAEDEDDSIRRLLDIVCLCLKSQRADFQIEEEIEGGGKKTVTNYDLLEDLFDLETAFKVVERFLGVKLNDPKALEAMMEIQAAKEREESSTS